MTKMADAELSFQQSSFPSEFHNLPIFLQNFLSRLPRFIRFLSEIEKKYHFKIQEPIKWSLHLH